MDDSLIVLILIGLIVFPIVGIIVLVVRSNRRRAPAGTSNVSSDPNALDAILQMRTPEAYLKMQGDLQNWGWILVVLGIVHLVATNFLSLPHGLLLIAVGLLSFLVREASMFVLYAVMLAWAAVNNLMTGNTAVGWAVFGVFQVVLSVQVFRRFFVFKKVQEDYNANFASDRLERALSQPKRTEQIFPLGSVALGVLGLLGTVCGYGIILVVGTTQHTDLLDVAGFGVDLALIMGVLGFALGLAAILSGTSRRELSIIGTVAGGLTMVMVIGLAVLVRSIG
ncbi:MAG: hypothetical protein JXB30_04140 [Anaerolineae bacterium]|nr:hypothetical protein [Anaerolineae bacterium]